MAPSGRTTKAGLMNRCGPQAGHPPAATDHTRRLGPFCLSLPVVIVVLVVLVVVVAVVVSAKGLSLAATCQIVNH